MQEYPNGQHVPAPQCPKLPRNAVVWKTAPGCRLGSCRLKSQLMGVMMVQSALDGQQFIVVLPAKTRQRVVALQHMFSGISGAASQ